MKLETIHLNNNNDNNKHLFLYKPLLLNQKLTNTSTLITEVELVFLIHKLGPNNL